MSPTTSTNRPRTAAVRPGEVAIGPPPLVTDAIAITENGPLADALYVFDGTWIDDPQELPDARYLSIRL